MHSQLLSFSELHSVNPRLGGLIDQFTQERALAGLGDSWSLDRFCCAIEVLPKAFGAAITYVQAGSSGTAAMSRLMRPCSDILWTDCV